MKNIIVTTRCYCCNHIEKQTIRKLSVRGTSSVEAGCPMCGTVHVYRFTRINNQELKVETLSVMATDEGAKLFKERTNEELKIKST